MEYLPGEPLDYGRDLESAARLFARIHVYSAPLSSHHLILEDRPLSMTYAECAMLLQVYFDAENADAVVRSYLSDMLAWASLTIPKSDK